MIYYLFILHFLVQYRFQIANQCRVSCKTRRETPLTGKYHHLPRSILGRRMNQSRQKESTPFEKFDSWSLWREKKIPKQDRKMQQERQRGNLSGSGKFVDT